MPDEKGYLSPEEKEKAKAWVQAYWKGPANCTICESNRWSVSDFIVKDSAFLGVGITLGGPSHPMIALICMTCGYTLFFNAIIAGLIQVAQPKNPDAGPQLQS